MIGLAALVGSMKDEAFVLRRNGAEELARVKQRDAEAIEAAEPDAVTWITEETARLRSGWTITKVRRHAAMYQHTGHAIREKGKWRMLALIIPQRVPQSVLDAAARREASS
ncbi:MAG: hypothetical protein H7099_17450 [Gemmatimonadaceae bacterium]|nr:hypothetical protein [Gemmatimonadaceae bacterium]